MTDDREEIITMKTTTANIITNKNTPNTTASRAKIVLRPPCRFYAQGFCAAGPACAFSHGEENKLTRGFEETVVDTLGDNLTQMLVIPEKSLADKSTEIKVGSKPTFPQLPFGSVSFATSATLSATAPSGASTFVTTCSPAISPLATSALSASSLQFGSPTSHNNILPQSIYSFFPKSDELCAFAMVGKCRYGEMCRNIHGLQCPRCLRYCLYPNDVDKNELHLEECLARDMNSFPGTIIDISNIECGICLDRVTQKEDPRFGLMNCDHAFCLSCIRTWRSRHSMSDLTTKSCPLCRTVTYFVIPSSTWTTDSIEKEKIIDAYKKKCSEIDCKYHNYGNGDCPFGTSCFYAHKGRDGLINRLPMRSYVDKDEKVRMVRETKLSDFVEFAFRNNNGNGNNNHKLQHSKGGNKNK